MTEPLVVSFDFTLVFFPLRFVSVSFEREDVVDVVVPV